MVDDEEGSALAEALVSLAITGIVLSAVLPAVLQARRMGTAAGQRAHLGDSGRLAGWRLAEDLRRAGFGLAGRLPAVTMENGGHDVLIRFLEGGFAGGRALTATAVAGEDLVAVSATGGVKPGDTCLLHDRRGGFHLLEIAAVDAGTGTLQFTVPLHRSFHPADGAQVQRVVQRRWSLQNSALLRDQQIAAEASAGLELSSWAAAEAALAAAWVMDSGTVELAPAAAGLLAVRLRLGEAAPGIGPGAGSATPGLDLAWLVRAVNVDTAMVSGSSLP